MEPNDFTASPETDELLAKPFYFEGKLIFTDRVCLLCRPCQDQSAGSAPNGVQKKTFSQVLKAIENADFRRMPDQLHSHLKHLHTHECLMCKGSGKYKSKDCKECQGEGVVDTDECEPCDGYGYLVTHNTTTKCPNCYGRTTEVEIGTVAINGFYFNQQLLTKINDPDTELFATRFDKGRKLDALFFRNNVFSGAIMGLRKRRVADDETVLSVNL